MACRLRVVLLTLLILAAPVYSQEGDAAASALQGTWKLRSVTVGGKVQQPPADVAEKMRFVFEGKTLTIKGGPDGNIDATFEVDAAKKPAQITIQPPKGDAKEVRGIFKIENNKLTICAARDKGERPTEFVSKEGSDIGLMVLERVKE
jgi:uncharacterized protein (TIGR03067 family)